MPHRPPRVCSTCGQVGCSGHAKPSWQTARVEPPRIRGRRLQWMRRMLFERSPLCVLCRAAGRITVATIRDHIVPLAEGGADASHNEQALCVACHDLKSAAETARGIARSHTSRSSSAVTANRIAVTAREDHPKAKGPISS